MKRKIRKSGKSYFIRKKEHNYDYQNMSASTILREIININ